jgi:hypothetical protein
MADISVPAFVQSEVWRDAYAGLKGMVEWRGMSLVDWVDQSFQDSGPLTTAKETEETLKNKEYVATRILPVVREWWLGSAVRAVIRRKVWSSSTRAGVTVTEMVPVSSEAFLVTILRNSEAQWYARYLRGKTPKDVDFPKPRFTEKKGRSTCVGFRGWNLNGLKDFNDNHGLVEKWRESHVRVACEADLAAEKRLGDGNYAGSSPEEMAHRRRLVDQVKPKDTMAEWFEAKMKKGAMSTPQARRVRPAVGEDPETETPGGDVEV